MRPDLPLLWGLPHDRRQFLARFRTDHQCRAFVFARRFGRLRCHVCHETAFRLEEHVAHCANGCAFTVSLIEGTLFARTRHQLLRWFKAAFYLLTNPSLSAKRLAQMINVTYKTGWTWARKLRHALAPHVPEERLRPEPRPTWLGAQLTAADFVHDDLERQPGRLARQIVNYQASGHVSDKHTQAYLDQFTFEAEAPTAFDAVLALLDVLPVTRPITYRRLVGLQIQRPRLELAVG